MLNMRSDKSIKDMEIVVCYEREKNDTNGNPVFTVSVFLNGSNITESLYKWYKVNKKGYIRVVSYNIENSIKGIIDTVKIARGVF